MSADDKRAEIRKESVLTCAAGASAGRIQLAAGSRRDLRWRALVGDQIGEGRLADCFHLRLSNETQQLRDARLSCIRRILFQKRANYLRQCYRSRRAHQVKRATVSAVVFLGTLDHQPIVL